MGNEDTDNNKTLKFYMLGEKDVEVFALIVHIRNQAKEQYGKDVTLDQAIAIYMLSKIMGGVYFFEMSK